MKRIASLVMLSLMVSALAWAQTASTSSSSSSTAPQSADTKPADTKDKKQDKKKKDKSGKDAINTSEVFNEHVANDVLGRIKDGLEGHSRRLLLSAFDDDKFDGYLSFEDQIDAFFNRYDMFRVNFRIANVAVEGSKGVILVNAELEQVPAKGGAPVRKNSQLRFEIELGRKGWRVTDVRDRGFFS